MGNKEKVIDAVSKLPDDASMKEIAREIELIAGIKAAREQAARGEGIPAEDAGKMIAAWLAK